MLTADLVQARVYLKQVRPRYIDAADEGNLALAGELIDVFSQHEGREPGDAIVDPATGDVIGRTDSQLVGRLRVVEVRDTFAFAAVVDGDSFAIGQARTVVETAD